MILAKFVESMCFRKTTSFVAYRESCASVLRLCRDSPHLVSRRRLDLRLEGLSKGGRDIIRMKIYLEA